MSHVASRRSDKVTLIPYKIYFFYISILLLFIFVFIVDDVEYGKEWIENDVDAEIDDSNKEWGFDGSGYGNYDDKKEW